MLLSSFAYRFFILFPLDMYLGVELLDHRVTMFNLLRNRQTVFQSSCIILHSHQQCTRPQFFRSSQVLVACLFITAIVMGVKECLIVVLSCISLVTSDTSIFSCAVGHLHSFFGDVFIQILCPL